MWSELIPFRYRGYYYDKDTGLYYLQSRYYDPEVGRFISSDGASSLLSTPDSSVDKNLYAYCDNNPVVRADYNGNYWLTTMLVGAAVSVAFQYVSDVVSNIVSGKRGKDALKPSSSIATYAVAAVSGAVGAGVGAKIVKSITNGAVCNIVKGAFEVGLSAVGNLANDTLNGEIDSSSKAVNSFAEGAISGLASFGIGKIATGMKVRAINNMGSGAKKVYLRNNFYKGPQKYANHYDKMFDIGKKDFQVEQYLGFYGHNIAGNTVTSVMGGIFG